MEPFQAPSCWQRVQFISPSCFRLACHVAANIVLLFVALLITVPGGLKLKLLPRCLMMLVLIVPVAEAARFPEEGAAPARPRVNDASDTFVPLGKELVHYRSRVLSTITVSTFTELQNMLSGSATTIQLAPGRYSVAATLSIVRDVTIMAEVPGSVVLDGGWSGGTATDGTRVILISSGTVALIGLNITSGRASENVSARS